MSIKDSMMRGLSLAGMDAMTRAGYANSKLFADIVNDTKDTR